MAEQSPKSELLICDYSGTARSGKGTIVAELAQRYPAEHSNASVVVEETGRDYRAITRDLLETETINTDMDKLAVQVAVIQQNEGRIRQIVAHRKERFEQEGEQPFYAPEVNDLVGKIAPIPMVRQVVKEALRSRVEDHAGRVRPGETSVVLLDGRDLSKAVERLAGTRVLLKTFVECSVLEAALRECADEHEYLNRVGAAKLDSIVRRNYEDQHRSLDPAVAEADALDFWAGLYAEPYRTPEIDALLSATNRKEYWAAVVQARQNPLDMNPMPGRGNLAVGARRQIRFDTTPFRAFEKPKDAMLAFAYEMFKEALESAS